MATIDPPKAIRVRTATGWLDLVIQGANGQGVPTGGASGNILTKTSATDFATAWQAPAASGSQITYRGDYNAATTYHDGDYVVGTDGITYQCVKEGTVGVAPSAWSSGQWGVPQPPVNGQWLKGASGGAVWSPIAAGDVTGAPGTGYYLKGQANGTGAWGGLQAVDLPAYPSDNRKALLGDGTWGTVLRQFGGNYPTGDLKVQVGQMNCNMPAGNPVDITVNLPNAWPSGHLVFIAAAWPGAHWNFWVLSNGLPTGNGQGKMQMANQGAAQNMVTSYMSFGY